MKQLSVGLSGKGKKLQVKASDQMHRSLQLHAAESELNQGEIIDLLLRLVDFRVQLAKGDVQVDPDTMASPLETFVLVTLADAGLLSHDELQRAMGAASLGRMTGGDVKQRFTYLFENINARLELLQGFFQQRQKQHEAEKQAFLERNPDTLGVDRDVEFA